MRVKVGYAGTRERAQFILEKIFGFFLPAFKMKRLITGGNTRQL
jgi:hypothetical protein